MGSGDTGIREGSLQAPSRHPLDWRSAEFVDEAALEKELERVFDICHGCRRCFSLCNSFPTLFDAIDASSTLELDGVDKKVYWDVVDHCYLCDMCFMTKCPYVPPHPWNIDFPHLMLRAKHVQHRKGEHSFRDKVLSNTRGLGSIAGIPITAQFPLTGVAGLLPLPVRWTLRLGSPLELASGSSHDGPAPAAILDAVRARMQASLGELLAAK